MAKVQWWIRFSVMVVLLGLGLSACYKDAGDDVQPTSNRVDLSDLQPTATTAPPAATATPTVVAPAATVASPPTAEVTKTLVPTTTPFGAAPAAEDTAPEEIAPVETEPEDAEVFAPTSAPPATSTPILTATSAGPVITTPGMSDIIPSITPVPTLDPTLMPTPTAIPIEENPCFHIVQPNDTLYSIAQANEVLLSDLVAANPETLGGSQSTPLQIGWQLNIPGCDNPQAAAEEAAAPAETAPEESAPAAPAESGTHVVQSGETIYSIARQYNVDPLAIIQLNGLANPDVLQVGDVLTIPAE